MLQMQKIEKWLVKKTTVCLTAVLLTSSAVLPEYTINKNTAAQNPAYFSAYEAAKYAEVLLAAEEKKQTAAGTGSIFAKESALPEKNASMETETAESGTEKQEKEIAPIDEYAQFAVVKASNYVNVRAEAGTFGEIVGHIYSGSVCEITGQAEAEDGTWLKILSGNVEGYAKAEFFAYGEESAEMVKERVKKVAEVVCDRLNVRAEADAESTRIGSVEEGDLLKIVEEDIPFMDNWRELRQKIMEESLNTQTEELAAASEDETAKEPDYKWVMVEYKNGQTGYVCLDYVVIRPEYTTAKTLDEEKAEAEKKAAAAKKAEAERKAAAAKKAGGTIKTAPVSGTDDSDNTDLRSRIIAYAKQFLGMKYVSGGKSLEGGTDCSGFTCLILKEFGYSIGRTPGSQYSDAGRSVSLSEAKPGDIICYGSGNCTHVAFYIGDNQVIHEANSKDGCIISDITVMNILGVRNVID